MAGTNGVVRIGRKGIKKFAFGVEGEPGGEPFSVDVVVVWQRWAALDDSYRPVEEDANGARLIPQEVIPQYHAAAVEFVEGLRGYGDRAKDQPGYEVVNISEALDFLARLREAYDELVDFFRPRLRDERVSPDSSAVEHLFSEETK